MENDWILKNVKSVMKEKNMKLENFSKEIGISVGEFSKILGGQRKNYYEYLPKMAEILGVTYHDLVKQDSSMHKRIDQNYVDKLVDQCQHTIDAQKDTIKTLELLVNTEKEAKENFKRKYEKMKARVEELENNTNSKK